MEGTHWSFLAHVCLYPLYLVEHVSESILYMRLESHLPSPPELSPNSLIDPFCCCKGPGRLLGTDPSRLSAQSQIWLLGLVFSAEWGLRILGDPAQIIQPKKEGYCPTPLPQTPLLISWPARFFFGHALSMKWVSFFFFWTNHSLDKECIERNLPAINSNVYIFYFTKTRLWNFYRFIWKCCSWSMFVFRCVVAQATVCLFKH